LIARHKDVRPALAHKKIGRFREAADNFGIKIDLV
jgi:hypothetical protein